MSALRQLTQHRIERALRERVRYRYVKPEVLSEQVGVGEAYRVQSPNCSRNIDPKGGVIDIALLVSHGTNVWCLCARNHAVGAWEPALQGAALDDALDALCLDPARRFWP